MLGINRSRAVFVCGAITAGTLVFLACTGDDPVFPSAVADGGDSGAVTIDEAGIDAADRPCDPAKKFDPPVPLAALSNPDIAETNARFTAGETTAFFANYGVDGGVLYGAPGGDGFLLDNFWGDIYSITRASTAAPFGTAKLVSSLSSPTLEGAPTVTADGKTAYFARYEGSTTKATIWTAVGGSGTEFDGPAPVAGGLNDGGSEESPYVLPDGSALYFKRTQKTLGGLYRSPVANGKVGDPQPVPGIASNAGDYLGTVVVSGDELTIYWSVGIQGVTAGTDIFVATRADKSLPFSGKHALTEVNTALEESPTYVSADGCRLYYMSADVTQTAGPGVVFHSDIYVATKPK